LSLNAGELIDEDEGSAAALRKACRFSTTPACGRVVTYPL